MPLVIMTKRCYLVCESITSVILEQTGPDDGSDRKLIRSGFFSKKMKYVPIEDEAKEWKIEINYVPPASGKSKGNGNYSSNNADELHQITCLVEGTKEASDLYFHIVKEIREQCPDLLYLDRLMEQVLGNATAPTEE